MNSSLRRTSHTAPSHQNQSFLRRVGLVVILVLSSAALSMLNAQAPKDRPFSKYVDAEGNISLPDNFETEFVHLGSIAVATKAGEPVDELHGTYARAEDILEFQKAGKFPDGAILVKDVRSTKSEALTTGDANYAAEVKVWFVMVKDDKDRFKGNDLWGNGWGWALFNGDDRKTQVATDYQTDCRICHIPARKTDWIFTQCYPLLQKRAAAK